MAHRRVHRAAQVVGGLGGQRRRVLQGARDGVEVVGQAGDGGVGQAGGEMALATAPKRAAPIAWPI